MLTSFIVQSSGTEQGVTWIKSSMTFLEIVRLWSGILNPSFPNRGPVGPTNLTVENCGPFNGTRIFL